MCQTIVDHPRPWQTKLLEMLRGDPHHRQIIWICTLNGLGGVQKSLFTTYLEATGRGIWIGDGTPLQLKEACKHCAEHFVELRLCRGADKF